MRESFLTPVLFLVFNRPEKTQLVFERIRAIRPKYFYIAADGPRINIENELTKCEEVRTIVSKVDWDCEPKFLYRDNNLGCSKAVVSAIDWFFENEEEGIIIEDDCLPDLSFFLYCSDLLLKYQNEQRVMMISGSSLGHTFGNSSYFFSKYGQIWGWASWRRAWIKYERNIQIDDKSIKYNSYEERNFWRRNFSRIIWDVQWAVYSIWKNNGIAILPNVNLVSNIGFDIDGTNYRDENSAIARIRSSSMDFPLVHPDSVSVDMNFDAKFFREVFYVHPFKKLLLAVVRMLTRLKLFTMNLLQLVK